MSNMEVKRRVVGVGYCLIDHSFYRGRKNEPAYYHFKKMTQKYKPIRFAFYRLGHFKDNNITKVEYYEYN